VNVTITLPDEIVEAIVERVLARMKAAVDRGDAPEYLSVNDAATYLGCSVGRVRKLIERRRIPVSQDGPRSRIFISRTDLDLFMHDRRKETRP
jgi:excisionase family DNA binding protein